MKQQNDKILLKSTNLYILYFLHLILLPHINFVNAQLNLDEFNLLYMSYNLIWLYFIVYLHTY